MKVEPVLLEGELPADFRKLQNSTRDLLNEMKEYAGKKLIYRFVNPQTIQQDSVYMNMLAYFELQPYSREAQTKKGEEKVMLSSSLENSEEPACVASMNPARR